MTGLRSGRAGWPLGWARGDWAVFFPQSYTFLISSDYERAEWRENIREQQKKCEWPLPEDLCWEHHGWTVSHPWFQTGFP